MKKILLLLLILSVCTQLLAQTTGDYRTATSGDWSFASTWQRFNGAAWVSAPTAPTSTDGVINILNTHTVTITTPVTADQVVVNAGGVLSQSAQFTIDDGAGNDLTVDGTWNFSSDQIAGAGNAVISATGILNLLSTNNKFFVAAVTNNGTTNWQDGPFLFNTATTFTNNGSMNISGNNNLQNNAGAGTFINNGSLTKTSTGTTSFFITTLSNTGTMHLNAGSITNNATFNNAGACSFASGSFTNNAGTAFNHNAGSVINGTGTFTNNGTLSLAVDQVFPSTLIFSNTNGGTVNGAGNLTINNDFTLAGDIVGAGTLTVNGNTTWNSGTIGRAFTNGAASTITLATTNNKFISAAIINNGTLDWQDGPFLFNAATTFTNNGSMNISGNNNLQNNAGAGTFINNGSLTKTSTGTTSFFITTLSNTGTMHLNAGSITNNATFNNAGACSFASGSFTNNAGTAFNHNAGSVINGTGTFTNNGTLSLAVDQVFPSTLIFSNTNGGTVNGAGNLTINNDFTLAGDIVGAGTLTVNGNTTWNSGTIGRAFTNGAASTITLATTNNKFISAAIINNGTLDWQDGPFLFNAATTFTNNGSMNISGNNNLQNNAGAGTFINNGSLTKTSTGTTSFFITTLSNTGTMHLNAGSITNNATFNNAGACSFASGSFTNNAGTAFNHNAGSVINGTGTFTNNGTLSLAVDQVFPSTLIFSNTNGGTVNGAGNLTINNDFTLAGDIVGAGTLTVNGNTTWNSGTIGRAFTNGAASTITLATTNNKFISAAIINNGTLDWQDGPFLFNTATTFTNNGSMNISGNNNLQNNAGAGTFINNGSLTKTSTGTTSFFITTLSNTGTMHLNAGSITNNATFNNAGACSFASGSFTNNAGTAFNHNAGSVINGTGTFTNNGTLSLAVDQVFPSTLIFSNTNGGTVNGAGNLTINNDFTLAGDIVGAGTLTVNGNTTWNSGTIGRAFTNGAASTITLATTNNKFISAAIINNGTLDWQDGPFLFNTATTFTNNGSMNISGNNNLQNNAGAGTFINNGSLTKTSTGTTSFFITAFTNSSSGELKGLGSYNINPSTFNSNGSISPGISGPGLLTINSQQPLSSTSTLNIEIKDGSGAGTGNDQLLRDGNITLAGTLHVTETGTVPDGVYNIISLSTGTISGGFDALILPPGYTVQLTPLSVQLNKNASLPLTLISFTAQKGASNTTTLFWQTTNEINTNNFIVEKSTDGIYFDAIGKVAAKGSGAGTYSYINTTASITPTEYYRLKMTDKDGKFTYSFIVRVNNSTLGDRTFSVFPNPVKTIATIRGLGGSGQIQILTIQGKLLNQLTVTDLTASIDLSRFSSGLYIIRYKKDNQTQTLKLVKQ